MKKTPARTKPVQLVITKNKDGFTLISFSRKSVLDRKDGLDRQKLTRLIERANLSPSKAFKS